MQNKREDRLTYIDTVKGIGIILMVLSHAGLIGHFGAALNLWIHSFHMPLFFIASGYVYHVDKKIAIEEFLKKKIKVLIRPYLVFGVLHYGIYIILFGPNIIPLFSLFFINTTDKLPIANALWFLTSIFFTTVIYHIIAIKCKKIITMIVVFIVVIGYSLPCVFSIELPLGLSQGLLGVGFYHFGHIIREKKIIYKTWPTWVVMLIFIVISMFSVVNGFVNMRTNTYGNILVFFFVATNISLFLLIISKKISPQYVSYVNYIGENSIVFLCLNQLCILLLKQINISNSNSIFIQFSIRIIIAMITLLICSGVSFLIKNTKLRWVLGK